MSNEGRSPGDGGDARSAEARSRGAPDRGDDARALSPTRPKSNFVASQVTRLEARRPGDRGRDDSPKGEVRPPVAGLEERFQRDLAVLKSIPGLKPDVWAAMQTMDERLQTLRDVERLLAESQNRVARRVYAVAFNDPEDIKNKTAGATFDIPYQDDRFAGTPFIGRPALLDGKRVDAVAAGRYIHVHENALKPEKAVSHDVRIAVGIVLEESRHGYQYAVVGDLTGQRQPEVDAKTREMWHNGLAAYGEIPHDANPVERDVSSYTSRMIQELYGRGGSSS